MSRRKVSKKRNIIADYSYGSIIVSRFINQVMLHGKKSIAEKNVYRAIEFLNQKTNGKDLSSFDKVVENVSPELEVKSRRIGGSTYQVPVQVSDHRKITLCLRWLVSYARQRSGKGGIAAKLGQEMVDAFNNTGGAIKKREDVFRMAEANKAFAHFRW